MNDRIESDGVSVDPPQIELASSSERPTKSCTNSTYQMQPQGSSVIRPQSLFAGHQQKRCFECRPCFNDVWKYSRRDNFLERLKTFTSSNWCKIFGRCGKSGEDMANAGFERFTSLDYPDACRCFFCDTVIYDWDLYDNPCISHESLAKDCAWIRGLKQSRPELFKPIKIY